MYAYSKAVGKPKISAMARRAYVGVCAKMEMCDLIADVVVISAETEEE